MRATAERSCFLSHKNIRVVVKLRLSLRYIRTHLDFRSFWAFKSEAERPVLETQAQEPVAEQKRINNREINY
ncbi:hypothetical protein MHYP_G00352960 [Metynnis hypsauchen]